ncbi:MAG: trypsin-like peptidase domain-containing protein [Planctomycetes bacterium]|nr:trypsin-like peptidase domain-containing protein [Planctomycetota bacterium]
MTKTLLIIFGLVCAPMLYEFGALRIRRHRSAVIVCLLVCLAAVGCQSTVPSQAPEPALSDALNRQQISTTEALMKQATCRVYVSGRFAGTGSLIRDDLVITAAHLFEGRPIIDHPVTPTSYTPIAVLFMPLPDDRASAKPFPDVFMGISRTTASLILLNQEIDLAILAITPTGRQPLGLAQDCSIGQKVMAPSYKHGKELIFPLGDVIDITADGIIYNASAGSGSSGGPIVNLQGQLVGLCKGAVEGGLKIMPANYRTIRDWLGKINKVTAETIK